MSEELSLTEGVNALELFGLAELFVYSELSIKLCKGQILRTNNKTFVIFE